MPNEDEEKVNLEHVFPRNARDADWPAFATVDSAEWSQRLGNLALLQKSKNAKIGNKSYSVRRPKLADSDLQLTKSIADEEDWTPSEIADRQERLADLALEVWPREPTS